MFLIFKEEGERIIKAMSGGWKQLDLRNRPEDVKMFCEICNVKNRGDHDWWHSTKGNHLAILLAKKNMEVMKIQANRVGISLGDEPLPNVIYICNECWKGEEGITKYMKDKVFY